MTIIERDLLIWKIWGVSVWFVFVMFMEKQWPIHSFPKKKPSEFVNAVIKKVKVAQLCPTLCDPLSYTVHGIFQVRILEWVAYPFSRGSSQPRDRTQVSHIVGRFFTS